MFGVHGVFLLPFFSTNQVTVIFYLIYAILFGKELVLYINLSTGTSCGTILTINLTCSKANLLDRES